MKKRKAVEINNRFIFTYGKKTVDWLKKQNISYLQLRLNLKYLNPVETSELIDKLRLLYYDKISIWGDLSGNRTYIKILNEFSMMKKCITLSIHHSTQMDCDISIHDNCRVVPTFKKNQLISFHDNKTLYNVRKVMPSVIVLEKIYFDEELKNGDSLIIKDDSSWYSCSGEWESSYIADHCFDIDNWIFSFAEEYEQMKFLKYLVMKGSINPNSKVFAKIETPNGIRNVSSFSKIIDGIIVGRGDLSTINPIQLFKEQIEISQAIEKENIPAYLATGILDSCQYSNTPSISDLVDISVALNQGFNRFMFTGTFEHIINKDVYISFIEKLNDTYGSTKRN